MTFAEYNTDENFNKPSNAMELVRLGKAEGKTRDEILNALSPLWKEDKKGNVKKALDYHFPEKAEPTPELEGKEPKPEEPKKEEPKENVVAEVTKQKSNTANAQNADLTAQQKIEKEVAQAFKNDNWDDVINSAKRMGAASKNIDDHFIEQLPTSIVSRYKNNEFGKAGSKEAQQRLAFFIIDAAAQPLKALANGMSRFAGQGDRFDDTKSIYQKYQDTNLAKGLENRWKKYETETANAMDLIKQRGFADEAINEARDTISSNNRLQTAFNRASEKQKAYILEVMTEVGDKIGTMNDPDFVDTVMGMAAMGESLDYKEAAGMLLYRFIKDPEKRTEALKELGFDISNSLLPIGGSLFGATGGSGNTEPDNPDAIHDEKATGDKLKNPTGNLKGYKALDGNTYDFSTFESKDGKEKLINLIKDLDNRFYNGEINAETYRKYRDPLYKEVRKHRGIKASTTNEALKANVKKKLKDLNTSTKKGSVTVDDYKKLTAKIITMAEDAGMSADEIAKLKKDFINTDKIKYKGPLAK